MTTYHLLACLPMAALLAWAAARDVANRRIPNWLTFSLVAAGVGQSLTPAGTVPLGASVLGLLAGFGLTFALFAIGALGGGDVKLMAGVGAWLGPGAALWVFLAAAVVGMVIVVAQCAATGRLRALLRNSAVLAINLAHVREFGVDHVAETGQTTRSVDRPLPYAVPVLAATLLYLYAWAWGGRV